MTENRQTLNRNLAQMLKGGVIMDVTTPEQARIAEAAGACAVMALERIPADIRAAGGVLFLVSSQSLVNQLLLDIIEHDGCACACHGLGDGKADSVGCTCNQGYLALQ